MGQYVFDPVAAIIAALERALSNARISIAAIETKLSYISGNIDTLLEFATFGVFVLFIGLLVVKGKIKFPEQREESGQKTLGASLEPSTWPRQPAVRFAIQYSQGMGWSSSQGSFPDTAQAARAAIEKKNWLEHHTGRKHSVRIVDSNGNTCGIV